MYSRFLTNDKLVILGEVVLGNLQVERRGALSYPARDVVVGAVAGAEPAAKVTGLANGDTTQVGADTQHDQPLGALDTVLVGLGVSEGGDVDFIGLVDLVLGSVTDEDGLASPLDDDLGGRELVKCGSFFVFRFRRVCSRSCPRGWC